MQERALRNNARVGALAVATLATAVAFMAGRAAASDPAPLVLEWHGPDGCQAALRVLSGVRRLLGAEHTAGSLVARAKVERAGMRWHLVLATERAGRPTVRELDAESCEAAADAAAVILALMIDPSRAFEGDEKEKEDAASPVAAVDAAVIDGAEPDVVSEPVEFEDAGERAPFPLFLVAAAASDTGTLPHTGIGFEGGLGVSAGRFRAEATLAYWPAVSAEIGAARGGSFTMLAAILRACALARAGLFSFGPCAGGGLTRMRAEGFGVTTPIAVDSTWATVVADALVRAQVSRFFAPRLSVGASVPLYRPIFEVQGLGAVHQPAAVAVQIGVGAEVHF